MIPLVVRPAAQAAELAALLRQHGHAPLCCPLLETRPGSELPRLPELLPQADIVIAVDLNSDVVGAAWRNHHKDGKAEPPVDAPVAWHRKLLSRFGRGGAPDAAGEPAEAESLPSMLTVMQSSISIMSVRIARSRLAGEPADVLISPRLAQLGLMDYHRGAEAIAEGEAAVELALPAIRRALGR